GAWNAVRDGQAPGEAGRDYVRRRGEALAAKAALVDFRLYWEALSAALAGRDKVIVDADKVPGRRHLWLVAPELLRPPAPAMTPADRGMRGRREAPGEGP